MTDDDKYLVALLELFAKSHNLTLKSGKTTVGYYANLYDVDEADISGDSSGFANSEDGAKAEYAREISGVKLIVGTGYSYQREVMAWPFVELLALSRSEPVAPFNGVEFTPIVLNGGGSVPGLSKLDWFAGQALPHYVGQAEENLAVKYSYDYAAAMVAESERRAAK